MSPSIQPVYDDRSTAMVIMVIIICILAVIALIFFCLLLGNRHSNKTNNIQNETLNNTELTENELQALTEYKKLTPEKQKLINETLKQLNSNDNK